MGYTGSTTQSAAHIGIGLPCFTFAKTLSIVSPKDFWMMFADTVFQEDNNTHVLTQTPVSWSDHQLRLVMLNMAQQIWQGAVWPHWAAFAATIADQAEFTYLAAQ
jgi:hypothetical protein